MNQAQELRFPAEMEPLAMSLNIADAQAQTEEPKKVEHSDGLAIGSIVILGTLTMAALKHYGPNSK